MKKFICMILAMGMALSLVACGSNEITTAQTDKLSGTVSTDGSTSMEKVIGGLGEMFMERNSGITFTYNPTGSGSGIKAVQEGRCDIGLASRSLKTEEAESGLTETVLAYDGIAVIVNLENPVSDLDVQTIAKIYTGEITNWSEVGGNDAEIVLIGREAGSGTRDGFESITGTEDACQYRQELTSTGDVITAVSQNPGAIGYASVASVNVLENVIHGIFLLLGLITVGCVLMITVYLVISGIPAIKEIGFIDFLFGDTWASTAAEPQYGIFL